MVLRQMFFVYTTNQEYQMLTKDERRGFSEAERIAIYRRDHGICQDCRAEGKPDREAMVPWTEYDADHVVPHSLGGRTTVENAQLLCRYHNRARRNIVES